MMRPLSSAGLLAVALCAATGQGYLPAVGPPALRFAAPPPPPPAVLVPLPPLAVVEPQPASSDLDPLPPVAASTNAAGDPVLFDSFGVPPVAEPLTASATNVASSIPGDPLVPQMFMKYFMGGAGTNALGVSIFPPVEFVPPLPIVPPSSSATFQTVPPAKP